MNKMRLIGTLLFIPSLLITGCDTNKSTSSETDQLYRVGYDAGYADGHNGNDMNYNNHGEADYISGYNAGYNKGLEDYKNELEEAGIRPGLNIETHTNKQAKYIADGPNYVAKYAVGTEEQCAPSTISLDYSDFEFPTKTTFHTVKLSETENFTKYQEYQTSGKSVNVTNLKLNTTYYWKVIGEGNGNEYESKTYHFTTKDTVIRNLYVPGTTNWRDLGNYITSDGKRIKQGLIYRSAAFGFYNGETKSVIDQETANTIKYDLGIKTDIDLANVNGIAGVTRYTYKMEYSGISNLIDDSGNKTSIKNVFTLLGDQSKYPAVFHCTRGRDRTGAIAFLLGGYLGMSQEDLMRDYLFTNFSSSNFCEGGVITNYISYLNAFNGNSLQEKIESYLLSIGVASSTLQNISEILK